MIEINVRVRIDTNDPREAYLQLMGALAFSGHRYHVSNYWLCNGTPLPKTVAESVRGSYPERQVQELQECIEDIPEVTQCVTDGKFIPFPGEQGKSSIMQELLLDRGINSVPIPDNLQVMATINKMLLGMPIPGETEELPPMCNGFAEEHRKWKNGECIHDNLDFDVSEDETPMFRAMLGDVDFVVTPVWGDKRGSTYIDFDVGSAEDAPLSEIDVEIHDLLCELKDEPND